MNRGRGRSRGATWLLSQGAGEVVPPDEEAPDAPTAFSVTPGELVNLLEWTDPVAEDLAGIRVYRSETTGEGYTLIITISPGVEEYEDDDVEGDVTYYYVLTAIDGVPNESEETGEESGTPTSPDIEAPDAPTSFIVTPGDGANVLAWSDPEDADLDFISIYRSLTTGTGFTLLDTVEAGIEEYNDEDVTNDVEYFYFLTASDIVGNESEPTGEESGIPELAVQFVPLSIPASAVGSDLEDFPVYVDLSLLPDAFWSGVQADGGDIRVTLDDGTTRLPLELVNIDKGTKVGTMFFLAPDVLEAGSDFQVGYGGPGDLTQPAADAAYGRNEVWADYAVVWHTAQSPGGSAPQMVDSTGNGNDGTVSGASNISLVTNDGPYGVALNMASKNSGVGKTSPVGLPSSPVSWSWWTKHDAVFVDDEDGWFGVGDSGSSSSTAYSTYFRPTVGSGRAQTYLSDGSNNPTTNAGSQVTTADVWYFWTTTHDQSSIRQYRNGSKTVTDAAAMTATPRTHAISMSRNGSSNRGLLGRMAEFRIRSGTLSDDWIAAEYNNAINAGAFLGIGEGQFSLYVATTGNDTTGDGSEGNPYATISKAASEATAGTTIHVAAGTYAGGFTTAVSGTSVARVAFVSTTPHGAVIDGDGESYCWRNEGNYVTVEGFEMSGANTGAQIDGFRNYGHHTIFRGNHVYDIAQDSDNTVSGGGYAEHGDASGDALIEGNLIHHIANEVTPRNNLMHGIYPKQRPVIRNNIIYRIADSGIHLYHPSVALNGSAVNNLVFQCEKGIFAATDDNYIANNIVLDCSQGIRNGSLSVAQENVTVTNNLVYDCADPFVPTDAGEFPRSNTVTTDPLLVNYQDDGSGDYHLTSSSPARNAGTTTGAPDTDMEGVALDGTPDIGPLQYVA